MKIKVIAIATIVLLILFSPALLSPVKAQAVPTPTYDPFAQPPLPEHPTQLESGRYLFWRYCMPCHGDVGQGLTDAFRLEWDADHQDCWARGCHSGRYADDSFPVLTVVPPLVGVNLLTRYSPDSLFEFLRSTHPPEAPGSLTDDDYHALVAYLYYMNDVPFPAATATSHPATATPTPTLTPLPSFTPTPGRIPSDETNPPFWLWLLLIPIFLLAFTLFKKKPGS